jgi:hypothetical protein
MTNPSPTTIDNLAAAIEFTELLRGHPQMHFLRGVIEDVLELGSRIANKDGLPHLRQAISLANAIQRQTNWSLLPSAIRGYPHVRRNDRGHPISPFYGNGLSDYPIWPVLIITHDDPALNAKWRPFLADAIDHLIDYVTRFSSVSHYRQWIAGKVDIHPLREYLHTALAVSLTLRYLVHAEYAAELGELLREYECGDFEEAVWYVRDNGRFSDEFQKRIAALERMLTYLDGREPRTRTGGNIHTGTPRNTEASGCARVDFVQSADDYTDEEDATIEGFGASLFTVLPDDLEELPLDEGTTSAAERKRWKNPAYQVQHVARANLSLPYTRSYLQPHQIAAIDDWMRKPVIPSVLKRLVAGMLLLGRSLRIMQDAQFAVSSTPQAPDVEIELLVDKGCWRIRPELPDVKAGIGPSYMPVVDSLCLPLLPEWRDKLLPPDAAHRIGQRLAEGIGLTERQLLKQLHQIEEDLRPSLLSQWLGRGMFLISNSHNAAALLTPYGAPHLHTLIHYEHPRVADLVAAYVQVLRTLQPLLSVQLSTAPLPILEPEQDGNARTGTPTASDPVRIKEWVKTLQEKLDSRRLRSSSDVCRYSNDFVRYSTMMIGANTLARGTTNPDIQLVDRKRRLLIVSDKNRGGRGAMDRLVPLARDGLKQFDYLTEHRRILRTMPGMPAAIDNMAFPILTWHGDDPSARRSLRIEAATTRDILADDFPGRLNALRKLFHTRLEEAKVPGQYMDTLCGHWHPGQEAYAQYSALSPRLMNEIVLPHLARLMRELGFRPVRSRLS